MTWKEKNMNQRHGRTSWTKWFHFLHFYSKWKCHKIAFCKLSNDFSRFSDIIWEIIWKMAFGLILSLPYLHNFISFHFRNIFSSLLIYYSFWICFSWVFYVNLILCGFLCRLTFSQSPSINHPLTDDKSMMWLYCVITLWLQFRSKLNVKILSQLNIKLFDDKSFL